MALTVGISSSFAMLACSPASHVVSDAGESGSSGAEGNNSSRKRDGGAGGGGGGDGGAGSEGSAAPGPPAVQYIGRFSGDATAPQTSWPGARIVARFDGTSATAKLSQTPGSGGGPSWLNVTVDGHASAPFAVTGAGEEHVVAEGLAPGVHVIELEKRTEANLGALRFEGFTFAGGAGLLAPPLRPKHRIEFLADSTIDGFGVDGIGGGAGASCMGGAPAQFNDAGKSTAAFAASALGAEHFLIAYSGKGLARNTEPTDTDYFGALYGRTLAEVKDSAWDFASWKPDVVVISLGGTDIDGLGAAPPSFAPAYDALVGKVRANYPGAYIFCTVWSQITNTEEGSMRSAMSGALSTIVNARIAGGDPRIAFYAFPEASGPADATGCFSHANVAHHQKMASLLATEIKKRTGW